LIRFLGSRRIDPRSRLVTPEAIAKLESVPPRTDTFDLSGLHLTTGEGRRLEVSVPIEPFLLGGQSYPVHPALVPVMLDVSRTTGNGYVFRMRFRATLQGPCMRCLADAEPSFEVDAREVWQPDAGEELSSPYVEREVLDLGAWARDALALELATVVVCREDCAGLCPVCGVNLEEAGPDHHHERSADPRWAKLSELRFD
jgi:uncharacterized protein